MKTRTFLLPLLLLPQLLLAAPQVIKPSVKTPTAFAIFIDKTSYDKTKASVEAYRNVVERDNLATYILIDDWKSPEAIKEQIMTLASDKKMPLEGAVFVGDIPIPMIRDAQYFSSAFKMNQAMDWKRSSIPSDRYYDDFNLKFDFLKQDTDKPLFFYYSLAPGSEQHLRTDIYTARIKPVVREGFDKYELLSAYFDKVVSERAKENPLDDLFMFRGHGYNSEAEEGWSGEQVLLREQLPTLFRAGNKIRFYDFQNRFPMKGYLLSQMSMPGTDVMLGHHHGGVDAQYINGYENLSYASGSIANVKRYLRSKVVGEKDADKKIADFMQSFDVPISWFDLSDSTKIADSVFNAGLDIHLEDLYTTKPNARFVMNDACFNGSFHKDDYIAGAYIFSEGKTIVTQSNSVNSLQDKWPNEFIGLLAHGVRIGEWGRHTAYLETHIIGDPTYRFANTADPKTDVNLAIALRSSDNATWLKMLGHPSPDVQAIALRKLRDNKYPGINSLLKKTYLASPYGSVRMECLQLLSTTRSPELLAILPQAAEDSHEIIRRMAVKYVGQCGNDELIPVLVKSLIEDGLSSRVNYYCSDGLALFAPEKMKAELQKQYAAYGSKTDPKLPLDMLMVRIDRTNTGALEDLKVILDPQSTLKKRLSEIGFYRNYHYHYMVPQLLKVAKDTTLDPVLRVATIEALGWFTQSYQADQIMAACDDLSKDTNASVTAEAAKTKARLTVY